MCICVLTWTLTDSQDILYLGDDVFGTGALLLRGLLVFCSIDVNLGKLVLGQSQTHAAFLPAHTQLLQEHIETNASDNSG